MNSNEKKDRSIAAVGTVIVHALIVLVLFLMAFRTPLPLPGEEGVEVDLGMMDQGMGNIQPEKPAIPVASQPEQQPSQSKEDIATQDDDEAPAIEQPKVNKPKQETKPVEQPKQTPDPRAMYHGSNTPQDGGSEGDTGQPGDKGKPNGLAGMLTYDGDGGGNGSGGDGVSIQLGNRKVSYKPAPPKVDTDLEIIKVIIKVNKQGKVVDQSIADGYRTTTSKANQSIALDLASRTTFEPEENAPNEQTGSITYTFRY